ncbi:hypothetical protein ACCO45_005477 [Purpureocillium lilacinum]|uniref:Uncharacterized protein n=1 Tax=Purpureocillium lilacinum TaxID=33203 RepID=A0ACC4DVI9_PURLI
MVRNIVLLGGNSHPQLTENVCNFLCIPPCDRILTKFSGGESRCEIKDSVRGKDVYIIQSGSGSATRLALQQGWRALSRAAESSAKHDYTFESVPATPRPGGPRSSGLTNGVNSLAEKLTKSTIAERVPLEANGNGDYFPKRSDTLTSQGSNGRGHHHEGSFSSQRSFTTHDYENQSAITNFQPKPGYKQWVAQAGTLVADLLTCAGADHIITMDLHDPQYQGFFDIPVDNLYGKPLIQNYIQKHIPDYKEAVIVSPDAGGAKRATAIADSLKMDFALIHKERRPIKFTESRNASMMLVGDISNRVCILVDDLGDTANTITRAAKLLKREGALKVYALLTHGVFSGDAIPRLNASAIDRIVVTNSVPQEEHCRLCPKLEVLDVSPIFAEAIRRVHHGESISRLFEHD